LDAEAAREAPVAATAATATGVEPGPLRLIGRRNLRSNNSWMHNSPRLIKGKPRCSLLIHPDDASARGLHSGDRARIASAVGAIEAAVEVSDEVMPGVVSLPHGWGHGRPGTQLTVAATRPGVNINDLTDRAARDGLSGCGDLSVPVEVTALA
ncbi:MAG: molybdopterin dinucleotide binding domain-containing protein, partial [Myxococcota bacterium]